MEAAEGVVAGEDIETSAVADLLAGLVDKSLVVVESDNVDGMRYGMLELVRQHGWRELEERGEAPAIRYRHAMFFLALAEPELLREGEEEAVWLARLEAERDNARAAFSWTIERESPDLGLRFAGAMWRFWLVRGYIDEARRWLEEALARHGWASATARARALDALAWVALNQNDVHRAKAAAEEGLELGGRAEIEDSRVASLLVSLGEIARLGGDHERAVKLSGRSLALSREVGDRSGVATALISLATIRLEREEYEQARKLYEESLALGRELDETGVISSNLINLGLVRLLEGDAEGAELLSREAAALNRERGHRDSLPYALNILGWAALSRGDPERAKGQFEECLALCKDLNNPITATHSLEGLACAVGARGEYERSARLFGMAEALRAALGYQREPMDLVFLEPHLSSVRFRLSETTWEAAFAEGRAMDFDGGVKYALSEGGIAFVPQEGTPNLTSREEEVTVLVAEGLTNRQIAARLVISESTVETHLARIYKKLGLHSRTRLTVWLNDRSSSSSR